MGRNKRKQFRFHECLECGYSLRELRYQRCPECGWFPKTEDFERARWQSRICTKRYLSLAPSRWRRQIARSTEKNGVITYRSGVNNASIGYSVVLLLIGFFCGAIAITTPVGFAHPGSPDFMLLFMAGLGFVAGGSAVLAATRRTSLVVDSNRDEIRHIGPWYHRRTWTRPRHRVRVATVSHTRLLLPNGTNRITGSTSSEICTVVFPLPPHGERATDEPFIVISEMIRGKAWWAKSPSHYEGPDPMTTARLATANEIAERLGVRIESDPGGCTRSVF